MEEGNTPEPITNETTLQEVIEGLRKDFQSLTVKYNMDMTTLNRILSTYEDEISSLKQQYFDVSYKLKQLQPQGE